jgi:paraquat-inducible protein A
MLAIVAADATMDPEAVWAAIAARCGPARVAERQGRLAGCTHCGHVLSIPAGGAHCPRCGGRVWARKPASLRRTWALLIAACICAIGAYAYPVMTVTRLGQGAPMTIIAGIIELFAIGWWPIGIIVFVASLTIPLLKLVALGTMLIGVHRRSARALRARTRLYRFVETIGRWSMIDIFMVSILTALVQFGFFGAVHPDTGAVAFAAVVILTMLAAYSFDPRLMWDAATPAREAA